MDGKETINESNLDTVNVSNRAGFIQKLERALTSRKPFFSDPYNYWGFGISSVLNIIHWVVLYSKIKPSAIPILLHYSVVYGPDLVNKSFYIYIIPGLALLILILNLVVATSFYQKEKLSSYFLSFSTVAVQIIFFISTLVLISING
jgi:hypothetical protein